MAATEPPTRFDARTLARLVVVLLAAPLLVMAVAMPMLGMMGMGMWWGWHDGAMAGVSPLWSLVMLAGWLVVLVAVAVLLYRGVTRGVDAATPDDPALEALRLAYARGDLTDEEFESRREALRRD